MINVAQFNRYVAQALDTLATRASDAPTLDERDALRDARSALVDAYVALAEHASFVDAEIELAAANEA